LVESGFKKIGENSAGRELEKGDQEKGIVCGQLI
jgi:hypothetical protein